MIDASVSISGKEFRQLYDSFVKRLISKYKPEAISFIKRDIDTMNKVIENRAKDTTRYNLSFMVTSGLVAPHDSVNVEDEKAKALKETLERFTDGDLDSPKLDVIVNQCRSRLQYDLYRAFSGCDFSDNATVTLTLQQYRELNSQGNS